MNDRCKKLYEIIKDAKVYDFKDNFPTDLYHDGIYLMYEDGQCTENKQKRIIRIGINRKAHLIKRLKSHRGGTVNNSIFRKHLSKAINLKSEKDISNYIKDKIKFIVIKDIHGRRFELEKRFISTIAQFGGYIDDGTWSGSKSPNQTIREFGLWNVHYVRRRDFLEDDDLEYIKNNLYK